MATTDIRNILYKSIEQEVSSGTNFKLFSVDNTNAYTIRVYIDSSGNKFSFEVNNDSDGTNYKIENYAINQNITIYKNKSSDSDIYYVKFKHMQRSCTRSVIRLCRCNFDYRLFVFTNKIFVSVSV